MRREIAAAKNFVTSIFDLILSRNSVVTWAESSGAHAVGICVVAVVLGKLGVLRFIFYSLLR
jgi:hypothetical protein